MCWMTLTRMTFSMSFDGHQWNIPVESYFFMFSSIVSIWSCPGTNSGSCLKSTNHKKPRKNLSRPNSCCTSNNKQINDFIKQTFGGNELAGLPLQDAIESRSSGSRGRLIGPLEGWRFQHPVRERFHPSAAAAVMTLFSIIRPLEVELSCRRSPHFLRLSVHQI